MADETIDPTVADASTTPATAEPVGTTEQTATPAPEPHQDPYTDPWEDLDKTAAASEGDDESPKDDTVADPKPEAKPEGDGAGEEKPQTDGDATDLEKLFGDDDDAADGEEKPAEAAEEKDPTAAELEKMPPEELLERQKNKYAKEWAKRNAEKAEIVKDLQFAEKPIADVAAKLQEIAPERFVELSQHAAHALVDANPEMTFKRAYAVAKLAEDPSWDPVAGDYPSFADLVAGRIAPAAEAAAAIADPDVEGIAKRLDELFDGDGWRDPAKDDELLYDDREKALVAAVRDLEGKAAQAKKLEQEKADLEARLKGQEQQTQTTEQAEVATALKTEIGTYRSSIEAEIVPVIFKTNGLETSPEDTPEVADFKRVRQEWFTGTPHEKANDLPTRFERFAEEESSVAKQLEETYTRIVDAQLQAVVAERQGRRDEAARHRELANGHRADVILYFSTAHKEFRERYIKPDLALLGKIGQSTAKPIKQAAQRVEVVSTGGGNPAPAPRKRDYATADDIWGNLDRDAAEEDALRAAAV
jgi:hypothetical protein